MVLTQPSAALRDIAWLRGSRACEPSESGWSSLPMGTRNSRGVTSALPASREGIRYLTEGDRADGRERGGVDHRNSHSLGGTCYFTSAFCESVVFQRSSQLILRCGRVGHGAISAATQTPRYLCNMWPNISPNDFKWRCVVSLEDLKEADNNQRVLEICWFSTASFVASTSKRRATRSATAREQHYETNGVRGPRARRLRRRGTPTLSLTYWTDASIGLKQTPRSKVPVSARLRFGDRGVGGATGERRMRRCRETISR
ncbi:hypothetical protein EVAR_100783_1 [Eumeta japonica]|uniref:Uncharacterized protein n=1 Tax=Eumeta variegata TaxID=151549 RepID=A0A4C2AHU6_EUMVA|nr:hypothetical protein EVAR_100783_1 [Eumeta japonica]